MDNTRKDFPMMEKDYVYLNSASTAYKPKIVIDEMNDYYTNYCTNISRGVDFLGFEVTKKYEVARENVAKFINSQPKEIIFTRGTTSSINFLARTLGEEIVNASDEIIVSIQEHHSNLIPWQELTKRKQAVLKFVKTDENGQVILSDLKSIMNDKTKIVAINHESNVMGARNNLKEIAKIVHNYNAYFLVDGAQGIVHERVDVKETDIDFYAFSGHKLYGPTGVGVLFGKYEILKDLKPLEFGGEMINEVSNLSSTYKDAPYKFEAGTMMIAEVLGLSKAIDYVLAIGYDKINDHIKTLRKYLINHLEEINDIEIYNKNNVNSSLVTFNIKNIHAHDVASVLNKNQVIVRAGHHCVEPLMKYLGVSSMVRISLGLYNNKEDIDKLLNALSKVGDYLDVIF